jgi:CheY-like chemotaxis protein
MAITQRKSSLAVVQHRDADVCESLDACLSEAGFASVSICRLDLLTSLLRERVIQRPGLLVLDIQRGRAADLEMTARVLHLPALRSVPTLLLTTASAREVEALPSLGPLVRYVSMPFDLGVFLALVEEATGWPSAVPPRRAAAVAIAQAAPTRRPRNLTQGEVGRASSPLSMSAQSNVDRLDRRWAHSSA